MDEWIVRSAGVVTVGFGVYHVFLPRLMDWRNDLQSLFVGNRKIVHALNIVLTYLVFAVGLLSIFAASDLISTPLGRLVLWAVVGFWALRTGVQVVVFGYEWKPSYALTGVFVIMTLTYGMVALRA